ncbi:MAG: DUF523 and DUF1722 domain-containing protein [Candidatus Edwardsbacteria bacterium]|nr:DUF523 and DUF1722 domain-containing protein [Candidatus Edwardsbacteria bacterium]MBU1575840.1 DUF523 and DUF1722 domain-containing protein [Candidatus Edwardsbacteria bacterium]MBU2463626.1 DUF523 and DUF1722 domain-containing protein [Candidatus Edwardsbacteria bacterium]MBU2593054.1 DUF523 and DUF1722 domain-containing protein [Candidatus Edwardsbacteria bacterium]
MKKPHRPVVVISKCLTFAACRYNSLMVGSETVEALKKHVDFIPICPEMEIGLGIPRQPIRVIESKDETRLVQPSSGLDVTKKMQAFSQKFLNNLKEADGFLLKSRSPSCGIKDVKFYAGPEQSVPLGKAQGFFGKAVLEKFPEAAIEDEARLDNFSVREHFFTKLFALADLRRVINSGEMKELVAFHSRNKYLLMAYSQAKLKILGRIVANHENKYFIDLTEDYRVEFSAALAHAPKHTSHINALMHTLGYFSDKISSGEKQYFLDSLQDYRNGKLPLSVPQSLIRSWIVRFNEEYLKDQTFFRPFPEELTEIADSGKRRKY